MTTLPQALDPVLLNLRMNGLAGLKSAQAALAKVPIAILQGATNPDAMRNASGPAKPRRSPADPERVRQEGHSDVVALGALDCGGSIVARWAAS